MALTLTTWTSVLVMRSTTQLSSTTRTNKRKQVRFTGSFGNLAHAVSKDINFLKTRISRTMEALHLPQMSKVVDELIWLRNLEDPQAPPLHSPPWPQPFYPELSGVDLFIADLKALEAYAAYCYYLSKLWSRPLPEFYDPKEVSGYFSCRPHVVALRLVEVGSSFAFAALKIQLLAIRHRYGPPHVDNDVNENMFGLVLKETLLNLGPTFIKVGQSLSTRPDIIGSEISQALSGLHDQVPPFPRNIAMKIIEEELGSPVETFFSFISKEPVAAASFGQVYQGSTPDGCNVAVKVQRPDMRHVILRDIYILRLGLGLLQKVAKRKNDLRLYADELGKGLVGELDYRIEAANASEFLEAHSPYPFIYVPKVFSQFSRKRVLTMEWVSGENPRSLISLSTGGTVVRDSDCFERQQTDAKRCLLDLVNKGVEASLIQLLETGLLHADPHPGNLMYTTAGQIGFLDFGLVCRMEKKHQYAMLASIIHIVNGDWASLVNALIEMDVVKPGTNIRRVTMDLEVALGEVEFKDGIPDVKFSRVLGKILSIALEYHFRMPPYFTLLLRSLASLEGLAIAADKNFKTFEAAYPYVVQKLLIDNSAATRRILHSVVLDRQKQFQWQKLALFLRVGATRKVLQSERSSLEGSTTRASDIFDVANLILKLLPSKDGVVLRRLLVTADGASLIQTLLSKKAIFFRQQLGKVFTYALYQQMIESLGIKGHYSKVKYARAVDPSYDYQPILRDRRLRLIFYKIFSSTRRNPVLMLRFSFASLFLFAQAAAIACLRVLVSLSEAYIRPLSFSPKLFAMST